MTYRVGVDVGGTFTDVLLINEIDKSIHTAKVPSTPSDSSVGVLNGIARVCETAGIDPKLIKQVTHGTTVATNAILTGKGAKVGLITTRGYRQILQIARSFVPGGLGGWVVYNKSEPLAPLELTREVYERVGADGEVVLPLDEDGTRVVLESLKQAGIEALTVSLINSFNNPAHENRIAELAEEVMPDIPVSISSLVIPELQEYERTITTVANSYVRPEVASYLENLQKDLNDKLGNPQLAILRSDGGLSSTQAAAQFPVKLLMSGPAGGVSGALWIGKQAGIHNLLTFDMGGTSTDVSLIEDNKALLRRETSVGDITVRASSLDVRTIGAGGGSIAYVPELTRALRVGPESAGAEPGPAAYQKGGVEPTVTDANVVLGYLPESQKLGGDMQISKENAVVAVQKVADALSISLYEAAEGIVKIVNENMFGALRLVSVEKGYDPRKFSLMAFGGAGPLHANALGVLTQSWPVVIPPGPGVLCAYGDATTRLRDEASRTFIARFSDLKAGTIVDHLDALDKIARSAMLAEGETGSAVVNDADIGSQFQVDVRYSGQGLVLTIDTSEQELTEMGFEAVADKFDALHKQLFTFSLEAEKEFVNLRVVVEGPDADIALTSNEHQGTDLKAAEIGTQKIYAEGGRHEAVLYDRAKLSPGQIINGPAIIMEVDSTTLLLPGHDASVDPFGNLLINPTAQ
jgi:N-methylhydantoinase A